MWTGSVQGETYVGRIPPNAIDSNRTRAYSVIINIIIQIQYSPPFLNILGWGIYTRSAGIYMRLAGIYMRSAGIYMISAGIYIRSKGIFTQWYSPPKEAICDFGQEPLPGLIWTKNEWLVYVPVRWDIYRYMYIYYIIHFLGLKGVVWLSLWCSTYLPWFALSSLALWFSLVCLLVLLWFGLFSLVACFAFICFAVLCLLAMLCFACLDCFACFVCFAMPWLSRFHLTRLGLCRQGLIWLGRLAS